MASINQRIESALSELVDGNIWPLNKPTQEDPDVFIIYNPAAEYLDYGDDVDGAAEMTYQVHWFARGRVNYLTARREIRDELRAAGFLIEPSAYAVYESDAGGSTSKGANTGWTHVILYVRGEVED